MHNYMNVTNLQPNPNPTHTQPYSACFIYYMELHTVKITF